MRLSESVLAVKFCNIFPVLSRPYSLSTVQWVIIASLANTVLYNGPLIFYAVNNLDGLSLHSVTTITTLVTLVFSITATLFFLLSILSINFLKLLFIVLILLNSSALYFLVTYNVLFDRTMMGNILNTRFIEAGDFLNANLVLYILMLGALPAAVILLLRIRRSSRVRLAIGMTASIIAGIAAIYLSSGTWLWFDKHAKQLGAKVLPWSYVFNMTRYQLSEYKKSRHQELLPNATFNTKSSQKTVVVLVIGESARTQNFSLYGYERNTNPLLKQRNITVLNNVESCSTYTTASVQCILSHATPNATFSQQYELLPSYLYRHGIDVFWRTNNWGEAPLSIQNYEKASQLREDCTGTRCNYDEVLLEGLKEKIELSTKNKIFVVLHQSGSHGPSYSDKYPKGFEVFSPVCDSVELHQCTQQSLINAYDNTIVYSDYFISQAIDQLSELDNTQSTLMYISDHGESLGEHGLYLHGTPYSMAPKEQKSIPFLIWASSGFKKNHGFEQNALPKEGSYSQANIFHSVMGAFDMSSKIYDKYLDIFSNESIHSATPQKLE